MAEEFQKYQRYVKERKGGVPKTASERGRYLMVPFISIELDNIEHEQG